MTEITAELKALADAALKLVPADIVFGRDQRNFLAAVEAYRGTQAKECRPAGNKPGLYWLTKREDDGTIRHEAAAWIAPSQAWLVAGLKATDSAGSMTRLGWTVHSECRFGETGVVATREAAGQFIMDWTAGKSTFNEADLILDALRHFRAPKLEISDEELDEAAGLNCDAWPTSIGGWRIAIRAVIAKVGGEK